MKKLYFLKLVLIILIVVSLVASFRAIYDDDESTYDIICDNNNFFSYIGFLSSSIYPKGIFYGYNNDLTYPEPLVSYLASKEKSPPSVMSEIDSLAI